MKKKYVLIALSLILLAVLVTGAYMFLTKNSRILGGMVKNMTLIMKDCEGIELIETKSVYGKLNGNGNGVDFFGAVLIKADSEDSVNAAVARLKDTFRLVEYTPQRTNLLESPFLVHKTISFDHGFDTSDNSTYYSVYFIVSHKDSNLLDIAGH